MSGHYYRNRRPQGFDVSHYTLEELREQAKRLLDNKIHGICFSPYIAGQGPGTQLTAEQIRERLAIVAPYVNWVRTFSCTEGNELIPGIAKEMGLKTLVGVWLEDDPENNEKELQNGINLCKSGVVDLLAVGNEVLLREEMSSEQLIDYIQRAQSGQDAAPVGYVDAYFLFEDHPDVADACEVIFANCYPYWEGYHADHALVYMRDMYYRAATMAKGKPVVISETGWPNKGTAERNAEPGEKNAINYLLGAYQWADAASIPLFYFSAFDEAWKVAKEGDVGAYWGLWDESGQAKYAD